MDGIVGFIGIDYKGNQAACFSKWFTNIELSVLEGVFEEQELIMLLTSLKAVDKNYISKLGEKSFATCSFTARQQINGGQPGYLHEYDVLEVTISR